MALSEVVGVGELVGGALGLVLMGFGLTLDPNPSAGALVALIGGVITLAAGLVWHRFWRINNDAGTFFH